MKILIVGLGGVGGYYGGLLAREYEHDHTIDICFYARGAHLEAIRRNGLTVEDTHEAFVAHPALVTDNAGEIGVADCIIVATKSYDLAAVIDSIRPCVGAETVVLPLLNGVMIASMIRELLPGTEVWEGCTYIVGRRTKPGVVANLGNVQDVFFGYSGRTNSMLLRMEQVFRQAHIEATFSTDIMAIIWRKFFFISTTASLTSCFDCSFGALLSDEHRKQTLLGMLHELLVVSQAEGIPTDKTYIDKTVAWLERLPFESTSSMHTDFTNHHTTEVENLTGTVIRLAHRHNVPVPIYEQVYQTLVNKQ